MALPSAVEGARYRAVTVTWQDTAGTAVDLTGATLTGKKKDAAGTVTDLDGTLSITSAAAGQFTWAYGANDVAATGAYQVQFIATFGSGLKDKTFWSPWYVEDAGDV